MMIVTAGATDVSTYFHLRLAADGTDATGLTMTNLDLQYVRSGATPAAKVDATALGAANSAHSDNTAIEVDPTDTPGLHRVDWPDAAFAAGVDEVILTIKESTIFTESLRVRLISATRGLTGTALPAVAAEAAGGLYTRGTGAGQINQAANGQIDGNVVAVSGDSAAADALESYLDGSEFMPVDAHQQEWTVTGGTLQPKKPDGTTNTSYSRTVGTDPSAEPIVSST